MEPRDRDPRRRLIGALAACYLGVQVALPLALLLWPGRHPTDFSWDMFSHRLDCTRIEALASVPGGRSGQVALDVDFRSFAQFSRVLFQERLDAYAHYLCEQLRVGEGHTVQLHLIAECSEDRSQPARPLFDPARDYCAKPPGRVSKASSR